uniref:Small ribosomal subunit protein uS3m n=1 Tax=Phlyctis petraea TaxID=2054620 RepID=A0A4P8D2P1_9LECA|nr:ribosomal protein S3 [Phlyctis petraea]QCI56407.1 ribosomal protein S3 [Phlyctis petraea]
MLKILKLKATIDNENKLNFIENKGDYVGNNKISIPANKEWYNSVYTYNKNLIKLLPVVDNVIIYLIRSYFNMYNRRLERYIKIRKVPTWKKRLSSRKIWVSKADIKHNNDKVLITLYTYNRQYIYYLDRFRKLFTKNNFIDFYFTRISIKLKKLLNLYKDLKISNNEKINLKSDFIKINKNLFKTKIFKIRVSQTMLLNKLKFTSGWLLPLKILLQKVYNKKIELNIVRLRNYHLNSDILAQVITSKIRNRKNKVLKVLKASLRNINTPILNKKTVIRVPYKLVEVQNKILSDYILKSNVKNISSKADLLDLALESFLKTNSLESNIINSIKYKVISGIKVQASGRLTRRITASRAIYKFKYVGTLKNIDSSYKGLSSVTIKGNQKLNMQYTFLKSKTKIGAFGLKGWVSSY